MNARALPFSFDDFAPSDPAKVSPAEALIVAQAVKTMDEARAEGAVEGRRLAMETIAADEAASLARIAAALEGAGAFLAEARGRDRAEILSVAALFLEEFVGGLAEKRELDAAIDLLRRLTAHSDDRRPTRLVLARASRDRLAPKVESALKARGLDDFVSLDADPSLARGEMRLEWRGGDARRTRREIVDAVAALTRSLRANKENS